MAKALQPYVSFTIAFNEKIFPRGKYFPLTQMMIDNGQNSAMFLEI